MNASAKGIAIGNLVAVLATVGVCDIAFGLTFQLQPLLLEAMGTSASTIGIITAMGPLGILLAGPFLPRVIGILGGRMVAMLAITVVALSLAGMAFLQPFYWWYLFRFLLGVATGTLFTVSEVWMLTMSNDSNRGRVMGIYTSLLSVTFAIGPMLLPFTGIHGLLPWLICIGCAGAGLLPLMFVKLQDVSSEGEKGSVFSVVWKAPLLFASITAATLFDSVMISFFSIFALRHGVELATASTLLGTGIISGVVFFYPLGMLADRWSKNGVVLVSAVSTIVCSLALPLLVNTPLAWPLIVALLTSAFGVYVVALAMLGDVFKGKDMVAGSAAIAAMWGVGGIAGPPVAGWFIDGFGINAFPATLAGFYTLLLIALLLNRGRVVAA